ncbi:jouberin-like [Contarinia nasturtii]|uniref:jouberin-like n=1 Tax=Contarinia nasturtii TaxID=265458 RepID=UPI0012D39B07|nr:jouberin-like [Contarinia nasturtii]
MNNKSTENLLEAEDVESLDIQSLELENLKASHSNQFNTEIQNDENRKKVKKKFMVENSEIDSAELKSLDRPIPAVRKLSLAPIASKRNSKNSKELKEDCNQLVWKQSLPSDDTIQIVNEQNTVHKHNLDVDSNVEKRQKSGRQNCIELSSFGKEKKSKKRFSSIQANEETTSFISYEEKHEKEDNSEHNQSNRSSTNVKKISDDKISGRRNEAFVDSDDNVSITKTPDESEVNVKISKIESKKKKIKSKSKKLKRSRHSIEKRDKDSKGTNKKHETQETYDFKRLIGVWIHQSSALRFDPLIRQPRVRVSFFDLNDGELLNKSNPLRNAVSNYEPTNVTFIQPILSNRCKFKVSSEIECDWGDEVLLINEDIRHIQRDHVIIFFEIVDILVSDGWYPICWAFLRPGNDKTFSNLNVRCDLQLYYYQRAKNNILNEWKSQKKIKYPANLSVTVASYQHKSSQSVSLTRPMSVLEEERTEDIYTFATDDEKLSEQSYPEEKSKTNQRAEKLTHNPDRLESKMLNLKTRLPGQQCKCPNRLVYKHEISNHIRGHTNPSQYGTMIVKFSPNGSQLAFHHTTYTRSNHEIIVMKVNSLQVSHVLTGHLSLIYDIDWLNERILISVASDRTAIVWFLSDENFKIKVLIPHPSFVYVTKWLSKLSECDADHAYAVTGGRDCILRVWKINMNIDADIELYDELIQHDNYITSLAIAGKSLHLYSADWNGVLLEWCQTKNHKENDDGPLYQMSRKIKIFPKGIFRIEMHVKSNRLFVQCDPLIYVIETTSAVVVRTIKLLSDDHIEPEIHDTFTISPCGSLIFMKSPYENQIKCIRISNEEHVGQFRLPISLITKTYTVTSLSYHPTKDLIACAIFGDLIHSSMFLWCNGVDNVSTFDPPNEDDAHTKYDTMFNSQECYNVKTQETITADGIKSILNRIDDLFFMAVRSSIVENDQFKDMELLLHKLSLQSKTMPSDNTITKGQSTNDEEEHMFDISNESNGPEISRRQSRQLQSVTNIIPKSIDSNSSKHTFQIKTEKLNQKQTDETQSDLSEPSNLTFEIIKSNA